jgi:hypothetical protein
MDSIFGPILYQLLTRRVPAQKNQVNQMVDPALKRPARDCGPQKA